MKTTVSFADKTYFFLLLVLCAPAGVFADSGVSMILVAFPLMLLYLYPAIRIEQGIYMSALDMERKPAFYASALSNTVSIILAIPISWLLLWLVEKLTVGTSALGGASSPGKIVSVILQAAWLPEYDGHMVWMIPAAVIVILVPAYFISILIKNRIVKGLVTVIDAKKVKGAVRKANLVSYVIIIVLLAIYTLIRMRGA